jgi:hypothetical protein
MSMTTPVSVPATPWRRDLTIPAGLFTAVFFLVICGNLAGNGAFDATAPDATIPVGWESGSLLHVLLLGVAQWLRPVLDSDTALMLFYVALATSGAALLYRGLRYNEWPGIAAFVVLLLVASHGVMLFSVSTARADFILVLVAALLIPPLRRLEAVNDVQAVMNFGLVLPLLVLAGPPLAALVPLLILAVPMREPEARKSGRVFASMLLVSAIPVIIVLLGVWAMSARMGLGGDVLLAPFRAAFDLRRGPLLPSLILLASTAPLGAVMLIHSAIPDRRRKIMTSVVAFALPFYLAIGNAYLDWRLAIWTPAAVMLATSLGWLSATRVRPWMRWLATGLLILGSAGSWMLANGWSDPAWLGGLMPIRLFSYDIAVPLLP